MSGAFVKITDVLDGCGVLLVAAFAFFVWPPLPLLVVGAALLFVSWRQSRGRS